ncbi:MAG: N-acetylmuramoyl-L-alanine amidase [Bacteroidota bacterium]
MEVSLTPLIAHLGKMLFAALLVERFLVAFSWLMNQLLTIKTGAQWNADEPFERDLQIAERATQDEEALAGEDDAEVDVDPAEIPANPVKANAVVHSNFEVLELPEPGRVGTVEQWMQVVIKEHQIKQEFWMQLLGLLIATLACIYTDFSSWVYVRWVVEQGEITAIKPDFWEYIFTGVIIGSGTKPVNFLINFLLDRKIVRIRKDEEVQQATVTDSLSSLSLASTLLPTGVAEAAEAAPAPATVEIEEQIGFQYNGGDRPERLEHTHLFKRDIDLIIYHHTAMHSSARFPELVRVFDDRGWLTGYHCVVFEDGSIRALCRWDRFSNNAKGFNTRSMSVAMMGNFETDPSVPFSNHDGRFGRQHPTPQQINAAARVTALWVMMHNNIPLLFVDKPDGIYKPSNIPSGIVPHDYLARKACPGNNFPHELFEMKVKQYHTEWRNDDKFQNGLDEFKLRPMVFPS